jgi:hypothetical protein
VAVNEDVPKMDRSCREEEFSRNQELVAATNSALHASLPRTYFLGLAWSFWIAVHASFTELPNSRVESLKIRCVTACISCHSAKEAEMTAEMLIHFPGLKHLNKQAVWLFPKLLVCLDCGSSRFTIPETELASVDEGS